MPGFATHIIMGEQCIDRLADCRLRNELISCPVSYNLGLQGPDIYFYYPLCQLRNGLRNIGSIMHDGGTREYFSVSMDIIRGMENGSVKSYFSSYLAGFISHYLTDVYCHPYVYSKIGYNPRQIKRDTARHARLENEIDLIMLRSYKGIYPKQFRIAPLLAYSEVEKAALSVFMSDSITGTYRDSFDKSREFSLSEGTASHVLAFFRKEVTLRKPPDICKDQEEEVLNLDKHVWKNSWDASVRSDKSFPELFISALDRTVVAYNMFNSFLQTGSPELKRRLLDFLGNRSYHSGLPVEQQRQ